MIQYERIKEVVVGIAHKYSKDKFSGKVSKERFEEYRQELFLEAYTLLNKDPDMNISYLSKCLWNRAGEVFYNTSKAVVNELNAGNFKQDDALSMSSLEYDINKAIYVQSTEKTESQREDLVTSELVERVLKLVENKPEDIKKFVIARLKLTGYLPKESYPEIKVDPKEYDSADITENHKILKDVLKMHGAVSGGTNRFKNSKRELFLELVSEFDVEDVYKKWYEVRYVDENNQEQVDYVKKFSEADVKNYLISSKKVSKIISIVLEE